MRARQHVERLLEIAVVGERAAPAGEQRLVAGIGDAGLLQHGGGLGTLAVGAQRLAIGERGVGILGIGAIALAIIFDGALRIGIRPLGRTLAVSEPVTSDMVWQPPRPAANIAVTAAVARNRAKPDCLDTLTLALDRAERASNKPLTLTAG